MFCMNFVLTKSLGKILSTLLTQLLSILEYLSGHSKFYMKKLSDHLRVISSRLLLGGCLALLDFITYWSVCLNYYIQWLLFCNFLGSNKHPKISITFFEQFWENSIRMAIFVKLTTLMIEHNSSKIFWGPK